MHNVMSSCNTIKETNVHEKSDMPLTFSKIFTFYVVYNTVTKDFKKLDILERCRLGVRMGKSRPMKCARLANQIQGFGIPDR